LVSGPEIPIFIGMTVKICMAKIEAEIIKQAILLPNLTTDTFSNLKRDILRKFKAPTSPSTAALLKVYHKLTRLGKIKRSAILEKLLVRRGVRTLSGVSIVTSLTKPFPCPGKCTYCPNDVKMPKSYISDEPAAARALMLRFDPYDQMVRRLEALADNGHPTDKIELIIKGGTWNSYPLAYQYWFVARSFEGANEYYSKKLKKFKVHKADSENGLTVKQILDKLATAQKKNEKSRNRIIGLTLETRPDHVTEATINQMRLQGATRIELGVQTTDDKIQERTKRGHNAEQAKNATKLLRHYGFKVDFHLMPQLPGSTPTGDLKMLKEIFADPAYRPDMVKIYPCTVVDNTELYEEVKRGEFKPYSDKKLIEILKIFKSEVVPYYCRISRLIRDIPSQHIKAGNTMTNLRQVLQAELKAEGKKCKCLRCREIGHSTSGVAGVSPLLPEEGARGRWEPKLFIDKYAASGGHEYFLSWEDKKREVVYGFCRLRVDKNGIYPAFIRELHVYGQMVEVGGHEKSASQHFGLGKKLMIAAEKIAKKDKAGKIAVIAGIGVREYYRKTGYGLESTYMVKTLNTKS